MYAYIHKGGCGNPAFYYNHQPSKQEHISAGQAWLLDGTRPEAGQQIVCGSCGEKLGTHLNTSFMERIGENEHDG